LWNHPLSIKPIGTIGDLLRAKPRGWTENINPHRAALVENGI
jgi:hypothetical protein